MTLPSDQPLEFDTPRWPAPMNVKACTTHRAGGHSDPPFDSLNLAQHVGDLPHEVAANRARVARRLGIRSEPLWLQQVHGCRVVDSVNAHGQPAADGSYTREKNVVCVILTADCAPVFLCDQNGDAVGLLHVGWRGLVSGVVEAGVGAMTDTPARLLAWIGPCIGQRAYEVGEDVRDRLLAVDSECGDAIRPSESVPGKWHVGLDELISQRLDRLGVSWVGSSAQCTFENPDRYFSYRRSPTCGRMASYIWIGGG